MNKKYTAALSLALTLILIMGAFTVFGKADDSAVLDDIVVTEKEAKTAESQPESKMSAAQIKAEAVKIDPQKVEKYSAVTKDNIYHKMLNTVDFFKTASGRFKTQYGGTETVISYNVDMVTETSYEKVESATMNVEEYSSGEEMVTYDNGKKTKWADSGLWTKAKVFEMELTEPLSRIPENDDARVTVAPDGYNEYHYKANTTNAPYASESLFPQEMTFGYLYEKENWDITGQTTYLGRNCAVIEGVPNDIYGNKLNTRSFLMYVDTETGILLKYEGYNADGAVTDYIITTQFSMQPNLYKKAFSAKSYEGYADLNEQHTELLKEMAKESA